MKTRLCLALCLALSLCTLRVSADRVIHETVFDPICWLLVNGGGSGLNSLSAFQEIGTGLGGGNTRVVVATGTPGFSYQAQNYYLCDSWLPSRDGGAGRITYEVWVHVPTISSVANMKLVAKQGDAEYIVNRTFYEPPLFPYAHWQRSSGTIDGLEFVRFRGSGPDRLDFRPGAPAIHWGYVCYVGWGHNFTQLRHRISFFHLDIQSVQNVSGRATLESCMNQAQLISFTLRPTNGGQDIPYDVTLASDGYYNLRAPRGQYILHIKGDKWLAKNRTVDISSSDASNVNANLPGGDANADNKVDVFDLDQLIQAFNTMNGDVNWNPNTDFNCDENVDVFDLDILIRNFNQAGDS
jgi:hypothetical protein